MRVPFRIGLCALFALALALAALPRAFGAEEREGGLIGTGVIGVLGVVTGLGSIHVNGLRITYDPALRVETAFGAMPPSSLVPGHTVQIEALDRDGTWVARSIERHQPLVAPVEAVPGYGRIRVLGATVEVPEGIAMPGLLRRGTWVDISGLWRGDTLVASRIDVVPPLESVMVRGTLSGSALSGWRVGGVRVTGIGPRHARPGRTMAVRGWPVAAPGGPILRARSYSARDFSGDTRRMVVEGYLSTPTAGGVYTVFGSGATARTDDPSMTMPSWRGLHCIDIDPAASATIRTEARVPDSASPAILARRDWRPGRPDPCG